MVEGKAGRLRVRTLPVALKKPTQKESAFLLFTRYLLWGIIKVAERIDIMPPRMIIIMEQQINNDIKAEEHLGLVRSIVCKYIPPGIKIDDTEEYSDGLIGLFNAIKKFDPEHHKFSTFAFKCISNAVIQGIRSRKRKKRVALKPVSLDIDIAKNEKEEIDFSSIVECLMQEHPDDTKTDIENKRILYEHYVLGKTWDAIGKELGVTRMRAMQRGQLAVQLLKNRYSSTDDLDCDF